MTSLIRTRGFGLGMVIAAGALVAAVPAFAASPVKFALTYEAPRSCPDEAAFVAGILSRAPAAQRTESTGSAQVYFEAHVTEHAGNARGFLLVRLDSGAVSRRDVPDASCGEIVASMAAIAALVIEGMAEQSPEPTPVAPPPAEGEPAAPKPGAVTPSVPAKPTAPAPARPGGASSPRPPPVSTSLSPPSPAPPIAESPAKAGARGPGFRIGLTAGATVETAVAPKLAPGLAVGVDFSGRTSGVWSPNARLSGLYVESGREQTNDGDAQFFLYTARLALCPVSLARASLAVRPCLELDLGQLEGRGEDTINGQNQSLLWLAVGPALHLEVALGRAVALEGQLGARALANSGSQFLFLPDTEVHEIPYVSFGGTLGVVVRFP